MVSGLRSIKKVIVASALLLLFTSLAQASCTGQFGGGEVCGNTTSAKGTPSPTANPVLGIPGAVLGTLTFSGSTSGQVTVQPQLSAGTPTIVWPNASGTLAVGAGTPIGLDSATGQITCTTCATLNIPDQVITGGAVITSNSLGTIGSGGALTVDCGVRPLQFFINNSGGSNMTINAPASDGSCILLDTNSASAGTIAFSGFSVGANTGDSLDTTSGHKFSISIWRINGTSGYSIVAHQ